MTGGLLSSRLSLVSGVEESRGVFHPRHHGVLRSSPPLDAPPCGANIPKSVDAVRFITEPRVGRSPPLALESEEDSLNSLLGVGGEGGSKRGFESPTRRGRGRKMGVLLFIMIKV